MPTPTYPLLADTLGDATARLPADLAAPLEAALSAAANSQETMTLQHCLRHIHAGEAADGQPWPRPTLTSGQAQALARADRAAAGLATLLDILHASERVRVDGSQAQQLGDGVHEGLLLACRGLAHYLGEQLQAA
ncbi:MAG: hypothetical protein GAK31_03669 [Stenotrophomonas maltophilia]|uniref:Uncharacterized protein n=1 Tax=Stenotrophomonas maltophilia TaxID=40324 RepID=A0A7V8JK85_STEMA|nr:MAG: hypothetical protein GAK31_03669 [Stenotrophomonas maltophilia]